MGGTPDVTSSPLSSRVQMKAVVLLCTLVSAAGSIDAVTPCLDDIRAALDDPAATCTFAAYWVME